MKHEYNGHLNPTERDASIFWKEINPKASSCLQLKRLLEMYASFGNWESVINLSSRAVLHLNKNFERTEFYYIWIVALKETYDFDSLLQLAKHLERMGQEYSSFYCLAAIAYLFAGKDDLTLKILKNQKKYFRTKSPLFKEALGLYLASLEKTLKNMKYIKKGFGILKKISEGKNVGYFNCRNYLRLLSAYDSELEMSNIYNLMYFKYPYVHEPYIVAALIAMDEKNWNASIPLLLQIINENPDNTDAILALVQCYEENGESEKALSLILKNQNKFHEDDYDYNYAMARIYSIISKEKNSQEDIKKAIAFLEKSVCIARFFYFPVDKLIEEKNNLISLNLTLQSTNKILFSINSFIQSTNSFSKASINSFKTQNINFKLNYK